MSSNFFLKSFRILLLPFALVYWLIIWVRNKFYDKKIFPSTSFALPVICVGNLSVGGTGKSPMVEYLIRLLKDQFRVATLSRGYKRRTKGYALADTQSTALDIGDEPMQFHLKFPDVPIAVGEERLVAIPQLLHDKPDTQAIILDDAFQHRAVTAGLNILLTSHTNPFTRDFYLPTGDLRDLRSSNRRASIIIVTKCPPALTVSEKNEFIKELDPLDSQSVFFTAIEYGNPYHIITKQESQISHSSEVLLVTGIANPDPLKAYVEENSREYHMIEYPDHHIFTIDDLKDIRVKFRKMESTEKLILTTEKDAVRLVKFRTELSDLPIYVIPVRHHFLFSEANQFNQLVINFINGFKQA
jgi:tetraacyldisaccharide 4'-kinase